MRYKEEHDSPAGKYQLTSGASLILTDSTKLYKSISLQNMVTLKAL